MQTIRLILNPLLVFLLLLFSVGSCSDRQVIFPPVMDAKTRGYCGSCHMAYQPSMLPAGSWRLTMDSLEEHFDEKITLKPDIKKHISNYHVTNAGDSATAGKAGRIALNGLRPNENPQRITDTPYFKQEHNFLENRILDDWVGSAANCPVCHVGGWVGWRLSCLIINY